MNIPNSPDASSSSGVHPVVPHLRVALLWHQHQPYYRAGDKFILPWVWLHSTKDYLEMAQHLERVPKMRATINLVPSLIKQIEGYLNHEAEDELLRVMAMPSESLSDREKQFVLENCFLGNLGTMIFRSARFHLLHDRHFHQKIEFSAQEIRDVLVHYLLAWTGEFSREQEPFRSAIAKDANYTEADKQSLLEASRAVVARVMPLHRELAERGQIELSTTPFYHPILPLLCDSTVARECMPKVRLPQTPFRDSGEARRQLELAIDYAEQHFGKRPAGLWPSEGSVSTEAMAIARDVGFAWSASDELVLQHSLADRLKMETNDLAYDKRMFKFFPRALETSAGPIAMFFRDHGLSDAIGFTYQTWNADDATNDFVSRLLSIREEILTRGGDLALEQACVSVILDGENCWEYYEQNGRPFLEALYEALTTASGIRPVTFGETVKEIGMANLPKLERLVPGSWINGNFGIWIGHSEDNIAWDLLVAAKREIELYESALESRDAQEQLVGRERLVRAREELLTAEGSDWCWWYGDDNHSAQRDRFDDLYRMHLRAIYAHLDVRVPYDLTIPILGRQETALDATDSSKKSGKISPMLSGRRTNTDWNEAISVSVKAKSGAMHKTARVRIDDLRIGFDERELFIRIDISSLGESLKVLIESPVKVVLEISRHAASIVFPPDERKMFFSFRAAVDEVLELALPRDLLDRGKPIELAVEHVEGSHGAFRMPETGWFTVELPRS